MTKAGAAAARREALARDAAITRLEAALDSGFLTAVGWDSEQHVLMIPPEHPSLGYAVCNVAGCDVVAVAMHGLCAHCFRWWNATAGSMTIEEFYLVVRTGRVIGEPPCAVEGCKRPAESTVKKLCRTHDWQRTRQLKVGLEEFLTSPLVAPLPAFGPCRVLACPRQRNQAGGLKLCRTHGAKWAYLWRTTSNPPNLETWCRLEGAIVETRPDQLARPAPRLQLEMLLGLQLRSKERTRTMLTPLRRLIFQLRAQQVSAIAELSVVDLDRNPAGLWRSFTGLLDRAFATPESERHKDVWDARVFGHRGTISFTSIRQPWLRALAQQWAFEDLPTRRGSSAASTVHNVVQHVGRLSESLALQRPDHGEHPELLGRADIVAFLNRLAFLETSTGEISLFTRIRICQGTAQVLRDARSMSLTRPGGPAAGLPDDFTFRNGDTPRPADDDAAAGRALPEQVLRHLYQALPLLEARSTREARVATELLMDTGRRPDEILQLPLDCLDRDRDDKFVLIYDDFKNHRRNRRLPITSATAALITAQQDAVLTQFPDTDRAVLPLLPAAMRNPGGQRCTPLGSYSSSHRKWIASLLPTTLPDGTHVTRGEAVPYAYRHSYAQRHADAGVAVDVLRELLGHSTTTTTQIYYRVTEKRTREAVDKVSAFQFDRHGNRTWRRAEALLDDERARLQIGQVAVPYGICTEPTNVQAGGNACPFRFRCVGCGHFRTDASYLPDLKIHLQDLLRDRERVLATGDLDEWARGEAIPSETEINLIRQLIRRVEHELDDLTETERTQIREAVAVLRATRNVVNLGVPRIAPPRPDAPEGSTA